MKNSAPGAFECTGREAAGLQPFLQLVGGRKGCKFACDAVLRQDFTAEGTQGLSCCILVVTNSYTICAQAPRLQFKRFFAWHNGANHLTSVFPRDKGGASLY